MQRQFLADRPHYTCCRGEIIVGCFSDAAIQGGLAGAVDSLSSHPADWSNEVKFVSSAESGGSQRPNFLRVHHWPWGIAWVCEGVAIQDGADVARRVIGKGIRGEEKRCQA